MSGAVIPFDVGIGDADAYALPGRVDRIEESLGSPDRRA